MKRSGNVFQQVCDFAALEQAAYRAFRANRNNGDALRFMFYLEPELFRLQRELRGGVYQPGAYHTFTIREPKVRHIAAAPFRDRVVHHAVCAVLEPVFEQCYIHDSYACRKNKGSHRAMQRATLFARHNRWFLKCDAAKYFESVDHEALKAIVHRLFKDKHFLRLLEQIIEHNAPHNAPGKGLPIGNLTSQYFANLYLDVLDHNIKEQLRVKHYVRYMDDFLCFSDSKESLHIILGQVKMFLEEHLHLSLKPNKCYVAPVTQGIPFLGMRIYPGTVRLSRQSLVRCRRKVKQREQEFVAGRIAEETLIQSTGRFNDRRNRPRLERRLTRLYARARAQWQYKTPYYRGFRHNLEHSPRRLATLYAGARREK
ncbi:MAG TPA: RNA-directed DNA polymerase [Candidatus Hydrogenedentes bacterium]|nr:RNA-directed DNA polymerase [Candidatus Hydrogenedentota bacterium]